MGLFNYAPLSWWLPDKVEHLSLEQAKGSLSQGSVLIVGKDEKKLKVMWSIENQTWLLGLGSEANYSSMLVEGSWSLGWKRGLRVEIAPGEAKGLQVEPWARFAWAGYGSFWQAQELKLSWERSFVEGWSLAQWKEQWTGKLKAEGKNVQVPSWLGEAPVGDAFVDLQSTKNAPFRLGITSSEQKLLHLTCERLEWEGVSVHCPFVASWSTPASLQGIPERLGVPLVSEGHRGNVKMNIWK